MTSQIKIAILSVLIALGITSCSSNEKPPAISVAEEFVTFDLNDGFYFLNGKRIDMEFAGCSVKRRGQEWSYLKPSEKYPLRDSVMELVTCKHLNSVINPDAARTDFGYENVELSFPAYKIGKEILLITDEVFVEVGRGYTIQDVLNRCQCSPRVTPIENAERQYKIKLGGTSKMNPLKLTRELYWMEPVERASPNFVRLMPKQ